MGQSGGELLDGGVDDGVTFPESRVVLELELTEAGFEVREGGGVKVVGRDAGVAIACQYRF